MALRYRVETWHLHNDVRVYEPQMLRTSSEDSPEEVWLPLNEDGYLLDPSSWSKGAVIVKHFALANFDAAVAVLKKAMDINGDRCNEFGTSDK